MIIELQSVDPQMLGIEERSRRDAWISLGRENRIDFMFGLRLSTPSIYTQHSASNFS